MTNIEKVKALGYRFEKRDAVGAINIFNPDGTKLVHGFSRTLSKAMKFGAERIEVTEKELFDSIYNLTEEEMCDFQHGCSIRTWKYICGVKRSIGFVGIEIDGTLFGEKGKYSHREVYHDVDDVYEWFYQFNHNPSGNDIKTAILIEKLESLFEAKSIKEEFTCWECGRKIHWLDIKGDLYEKFNALDEKYCGC